MTFFLALKNTRLYFRKRLPLALFLAATLALLFLGNTVFSGTDSGMSRTFRTSLTADLSLSAVSEDPFTLFGSETPLLGGFFKMPLILDYPKVRAKVEQALPATALQPVVVGAAKISLGGFSAPAPLFAVDLGDYFRFFPSLKILQGVPPEPGRPGLFLNEKMYAKATASLGHAPVLGEVFHLASAQESSFSLRDVPLAGVFTYPVFDPVLENVALVDVGTGRALAGYFITKSETPVTVVKPEPEGDDMFNDVVDSPVTETKPVTFEGVLDSIEASGTTLEEDPQTWNFLLVRTKSPSASAALLTQALSDSASPVQVRDWRDTAGGNAKIVWFIQLVFNLGLVFISLVAGLIVMNSMSLAVAERTREIGTMRSLGASRPWVAQLVFWETLILVTGAGTVGVVAGSVLVTAVAALGGVTIDNSFLASLLGGGRYRPDLSSMLMLGHLALSLALGAFATILPVRKALGVTPLQAMARE